MKSSRPPLDEFMAAAHRFFDRPVTVIALGGSSGYSGSYFAQVRDGDGTLWCVRRWPHDTDEDRLRFIHRVLRESRAGGFYGVPTLREADGDSVVRIGSMLYDAQSWVLGTPIAGRADWGSRLPNTVHRLPRDEVIALARAVAEFHRSTAHLAPQEDSETATVAARLVRVMHGMMTEYGRLTIRAGSLRDITIHALVARWLDLLPKLLQTAQRIVLAHPDAANSTMTALHGDLWAEHVTFEGDLFAGFTDFERVAFGCPGTDLAQVIVHFNGWADAEPVLSAYESVRPLSDTDHALVAAAAALDMISEALWSIGRLVDGDTADAERGALVHNLRAMVESAADVAVA